MLRTKKKKTEILNTNKSSIIKEELLNLDNENSCFHVNDALLYKVETTLNPEDWQYSNPLKEIKISVDKKNSPKKKLKKKKKKFQRMTFLPWNEKQKADKKISERKKKLKEKKSITRNLSSSKKNKKKDLLVKFLKHRKRKKEKVELHTQILQIEKKDLPLAMESFNDSKELLEMEKYIEKEIKVKRNIYRKRKKIKNKSFDFNNNWKAKMKKSRYEFPSYRSKSNRFDTGSKKIFNQKKIKNNENSNLKKKSKICSENFKNPALNLSMNESEGVKFANKKPKVFFLKNPQTRRSSRGSSVPYFVERSYRYAKRSNENSYKNTSKIVFSTNFMKNRFQKKKEKIKIHKFLRNNSSKCSQDFSVLKRDSESLIFIEKRNQNFLSNFHIFNPRLNMKGSKSRGMKSRFVENCKKRQLLVKNLLRKNGKRRKIVKKFFKTKRRPDSRKEKCGFVIERELNFEVSNSKN